MSFVFMIAACGFALVLSCAVACVDRWRDARMAGPRLSAEAPVKAAAEPVRPAEHRRAA